MGLRRMRRRCSESLPSLGGGFRAALTENLRQDHFGDGDLSGWKPERTGWKPALPGG